MFGDQKTVARGGFGMYYQRLSQQTINLLSLSAPFSVQPLSNNATPSPFQLANPFPIQPAPSAIVGRFIPQGTHFAGLRRLSGTGPLNPNDPNVAPVFVNDDGQACLNYGGTATNCSINLASFTSISPDAYMPYTMQYNLLVQRQVGQAWALEIGFVGTRYVGGLGIWDPHIATLASPTNPITVRDVNGSSAGHAHGSDSAWSGEAAFLTVPREENLVVDNRVLRNCGSVPEGPNVYRYHYKLAWGSRGARCLTFDMALLRSA